MDEILPIGRVSGRLVNHLLVMERLQEVIDNYEDGEFYTCASRLETGPDGLEEDPGRDEGDSGGRAAPRPVLSGSPTERNKPKGRRKSAHSRSAADATLMGGSAGLLKPMTRLDNVALSPVGLARGPTPRPRVFTSTPKKEHRDKENVPLNPLEPELHQSAPAGIAPLERWLADWQSAAEELVQRAASLPAVRLQLPTTEDRDARREERRETRRGRTADE